MKALSHPWLALFRLPNLFTVPGDVLVGFVIVMPRHTAGLFDLVFAVIAALFFYMAGLAMNDLVDVEKDRRERRGRPIADGRITPKAARNAVFVLLAGGLLLCAAIGVPPLLVGAMLGGIIFLYNMYARANRFFGAVTMGLCRSGSVLLGAAAALPSGWPGWELYYVALWWTAMIGAVTWIAAKEVMRRPFGRVRWLPLQILVAGGLAILLFSEQQNPQSLFRAVFGIAFAVLLAYQAAVRLGMSTRVKTPSGRLVEYDPDSLYPPAIGILISALIPMQAAMLILFSDEPWVLLCALLLLLCWPISRWFAKKFSPS
ncbi:MAG TPA: UbiA family prenyltransferase [Kiritimatiellia bacterium]|nr:UbiA family prenyltransferase [Kiritimatiellia bacterium]